MPKIGDVVIYSYLGRSLNALVIGTRNGEASHLGANDEPLVSVAFVDQLRDSAFSQKRPTGNFTPQAAEPTVYIERDVVHASHEFSKQFRLDNGLKTDAQIAALRGHGEWAEAVIAKAINWEGINLEGEGRWVGALVGGADAQLGRGAAIVHPDIPEPSGTQATEPQVDGDSTEPKAE